MLKKIMFALLSLLMLYSTAVIAYRIFEPTASYHIGDEDTYLDYASLKEYVKSTGDSSVHYLFFYSSEDNTSVYLKNTVIAAVENDTSLQFTRIIETVDITELVRSMQTNQLSEDWHISSYPAFAAAAVQDGKIIVQNTLENTKEHQLTASDIEDWLRENGLYAGTSQ
ncbi:MAG: hypothetical protein LKF53_05915 [Solobacterium sp.]|jgi:hypothetical protein|nr:hypothetical protein [Solobacterium sp.]MCH4205909.1 hypothetical protein [Solobacterium sp.]MCH4226258.1 hypothetical protein [Solobacterium sp.]MCH4282697.1 hypothetical protein [Solobacterium sp.]